MTPMKLLVAVACLAVSVTGFSYKTGSMDCDFTGIDLDTAISRMLAKIPKYEDSMSASYEAAVAGIDFLGVNMTGMNKLSRYGPVIPYCINGTRMVQVEFVNDGDVVVSVPWKACDGSEGTIDLTADLARFTTQLRVTTSGLDDVSFSHEGPVMPVASENIMLKLTGVGSGPMMVTEFLSMVFPAVVRNIWNDQFFYYVNISMRKAVA